ncbi:uncharacterized protein K02A2.6-like [Armigeres subalbatus]|uniref:uncharacterized protein K02A2.6-like n=1 Tax=Armigeres subalbatus TaxID=124917 RepID=UPI002ECFEEC9
MRRANTAVKRQYHVIPTLDDLLTRLNGSQWFTRLDIKDAYHQIELHESSRYITTFITHLGMFRYTRLMFGISSASEYFQRTLEQILCNCPNTFNFQDDIFIYGKTEEEHDEALSRTLDTLEAHNVVLNTKKSKFKVQETEFLGHHISRNGLKPTDDKIVAILSFRSPRTSEEVRSFLGLVGYVGRFIPDLATKTFDLRQLITGGHTFEWESRHEIAFNALKEAICTAPILGYFDNERRTRVIADASPVGLGAVLVQFEDENDDKPTIISYASKSLSATERRYCQTEKEALAIIWSVEKFQFYLIGREFELETDHRPLTAIFKSTSQPPGRIERWVLRLQPFKFRIIYKPGKDNVADSLSRLSNSNNNYDVDNSDDHLYIAAITESVAIDVSEIKNELDKDSEIILVKDAILTAYWNNESIRTGAKMCVPFQKNLSLLEGCVLRGCRLVIPKQLRARMLQLAHEGHPGETLMITRLRDKVWWPGMDADAKKVVKECEGCRLVSKPSAPEPMQRRTMPVEPWVDVAMDFLGPLPSGDYLLVVVDYYSRYKEICIMKKITSEETIKRLEPIFVRQGYPRTITLDNGRQFISKDFEDYCFTRNIHLKHTAPYWPQANGEVERQNSSLLKRLKISHSLNRDWKSDLLQYLLMYNTTPHSVTGKPPTMLLHNRVIRSKIPCVSDLERMPPAKSSAHDRDIILKHKGKESEDLRRHAKPTDIQIGDKVLLQNLISLGKLTPTFDKTVYEVVERSEID